MYRTSAQAGCAPVELNTLCQSDRSALPREPAALACCSSSTSLICGSDALVRHDIARRHVEPGEREPTQEIAAHASRRERTRAWAASRRGAAERLTRRLQLERGRHRSVDAVFEMAERDGEVGGGIMAGALAYRFFIWLLPVALVAVAGLGFAADTSSESPEETAESLGLDGLISSSIANAANSPNRWYALLIGIPVLIWATRSVLRVLIGAHRLVWTDARTRAPRPKLVASLRLLALLLCFAVVSAAASAARAWSTGPGVIATLAALVAYAGLWLLISVRLPQETTST
jgi:hypothetical protein